MEKKYSLSRIQRIFSFNFIKLLIIKLQFKRSYFILLFRSETGSGVYNCDVRRIEGDIIEDVNFGDSGFSDMFCGIELAPGDSRSAESNTIEMEDKYRPFSNFCLKVHAGPQGRVYDANVKDSDAEIDDRNGVEGHADWGRIAGCEIINVWVSV